jgi:hypothetical protein
MLERSLKQKDGSAPDSERLAYGRFTEGFEMTELKAAKSLLAQL